MPQYREWCLVAILVRKCFRKTSVYTSSENTCVCVILTDVDRTNTVFLITTALWRQAVRLKPTRASCRCCQPSASTPKAKEIGYVLASARVWKNIYKGNQSNWIFDYKPALPKGVCPLNWFGFTTCCQRCQWRDLTISAIWLNSEKDPDVLIAQPSVCIATITCWCWTLTEEGGLYMTPPALANIINM